MTANERRTPKILRVLCATLRPLRPFSRIAETKGRKARKEDAKGARSLYRNMMSLDCRKRSEDFI